MVTDDHGSTADYWHHYEETVTMNAAEFQARIDSIDENEGDSHTDALLIEDDLIGFTILTDEDLAAIDESVDFDPFEDPEDLDAYLAYFYEDSAQWADAEDRYYEDMMLAHEADENPWRY